ncbi:ABC transporter permease subunit [Beduinella massiliensis]|uniref:ABC transporter permease subunit n=1 Tax=Beduinella massiliensis TaxID=1852363 RepID=UPI000C839BDB
MQPKKMRLLRRSAHKYWDLYLLLIPVLVYFIVFKYLPMYGLQISFRNYQPRKGFLGSEWVGLKHFARFFSSYNCFQIIGNTVILSLLNLLFCFPLPILLALLLNEMRNGAYKKVVQTATYAPHFLSTVVVVGMLTAFCSPSTGIVNTILRAFGRQPIYFMAKGEWFRPLYIISEVWTSMGWDSIIFLSALAGVDVQMYEAARIDGASRVKQLLYITLPSIVPTIAVMLILNCGRVMNIGFEKVFLMQTDLNLSVSEVISTFVYRQGIADTQTSYATAVGLMNSGVNFLLVILVNEISKRVSEVGLW